MKKDSVTKRALTRGAILLGLAIIFPLSAMPQELGGGERVDIPVIRLFLGLFVCALFAFLAALVLKHRMGGASPFRNLKGIVSLGRDTSRSVRVLESHRLGVHGDVCRFTSTGTEYLVIVSANGALLLKETPLPGPPTHPAATEATS